MLLVSSQQLNSEASMFKAIWVALTIAFALVILPTVAAAIEEQQWSEFHAIAVQEYTDEFTAIFAALEFKRSKNGRSMIRRPGDKSFKFVAKA
jgi:hypothetical protein